MPTIENITLRDIAAAIADDDAARLSVSQITVSITYNIDRSSDQTDWMEEWYQEYLKREVTPF